MKKIFVLLLAAVMCFSFVACGGDKETNNNNETQTNASSLIDISKLEGTWRGTEDGANWEMYFVFDGNGNMTWYTKALYNDSISIDGTFKYEKEFYWSTEEAGTFCPVEITEENGNVQYNILYMICEEVENFTPNIAE